MRRYVEALDLPGTVLTPAPPGGQSLERVGRCRVTAVPYWFGAGDLARGHGIPANLRRRPTRVLQVPSLLRSLERRALAEGPAVDVIVAHWAVPSGLVGARVAERLGIPLVTVLHSGGVHALAAVPGGRRWARVVARASTRVVATSRFIRDRFLGLLRPDLRRRVEARTVVLPMGADLPAAAEHQRDPGAEDGPARVLYLGRLAPIKGVDVLIRAFASLDGAVLDIAGDGPAGAELERLAAPLGDRVRFHGRVGSGRKAELLAEASLIAVPSRRLRNGRTEGLPVALLEGLAFGLPAVATAVGGIPEVLEGSGAGTLVAPDQPSALSAAIQAILDDDATRRRMGRRAQKIAAGWSWARMGSEHRSVILEAAASA